MGSKRYAPSDRERLLAQLIAVAVPAAKSHSSDNISDARARRVLVDLLKAPLSGFVVRPSVVAKLRKAPTTDVRRWCSTLYILLYTAPFLAHGPIVTTQGQLRHVVSDVLHAHAELRGRIEDGQWFLELSGSVEAMLWFQATALVLAAGQSLRQCACGGLFVRSGKRQYCSGACQKRFYMRRFRAGNVGKE